MMILGSYNRNPFENNAFPTIIMDDLSPQKMEALNSIIKKFIHVIRQTVADIKEIFLGSHSNNSKKKRWHDDNTLKREFYSGEYVLLFNNRLRHFKGKVKTKLSGLFMISNVYSNG